ncbi:hypothetical protein [Mesorhizobium onobrychidis]|uniref:Uncharacterized protein n=1 Tax=Mesorhizobium onobrychidis TaxID=2775404 RepID=A0ABY5QRX2_9HYPH|nr:hypothetical protein [Mesorhizobium onobrychidis]UVC13763.1 hypothetical protein IHQ72_24100 [Mesorhizobium onobrychidis]
MFIFAKTYRLNADVLVVPQIGPSLSDHPRRFLYFQALENYLRCFLLLQGKTPDEVRDYQHRFGKMLDESKRLGLVVPKAVEKFIHSRTLSSDYTRIRYDFKLDDPEDPTRQPPPMQQMQRAVRVLEQAVGRAVEAADPEFITMGDLKLFKISFGQCKAVIQAVPAQHLRERPVVIGCFAWLAGIPSQTRRDKLLR